MRIQGWADTSDAPVERRDTAMVRIAYALALLDALGGRPTASTVARAVRFGHQALVDVRHVRIGKIDSTARSLLDMILSLSVRLAAVEDYSDWN